MILEFVKKEKKSVHLMISYNAIRKNKTLAQVLPVAVSVEKKEQAEPEEKEA